MGEYHVHIYDLSVTYKYRKLSRDENKIAIKSKAIHVIYWCRTKFWLQIWPRPKILPFSQTVWIGLLTVNGLAG